MAGPVDPISLNLARIVHALLTRPRGIRVDQLMVELVIKPRTYRKYRKLLQERFGPFLRGDGSTRVAEVREGDARYLRLVDVPETDVTQSDFVARVAAINLARQLVGFVADTDIGDAFDSLFADVTHRVGDPAFVLNGLLRNAARKFFQVPWAPKVYADQRETLRTVIHALVFNRRVELDYDSASTERSTMEVEPLSLVAHRGGLYLLARHVDFTDTRTYAVDRIRGARKLEARFAYPSVDEFDPARYTEGCFGIFREPEGEPIDVELIFADKRWLRLDLRERRWHPSQRFEELDDGRLRMRFRVSSMVEVWPWIRSFGDDVEVVRPDAPVS